VILLTKTCPANLKAIGPNTENFDLADQNPRAEPRQESPGTEKPDFAD
jgi:hypothetical protein